MFGIAHLSTKSGKEQAQIACLTGDREADKSAALAQHRADLASIAQQAALLRDAQKQAELARATASAATARAARLSASLEVLQRTDAATKTWGDVRIPQALHDSTVQP